MRTNITLPGDQHTFHLHKKPRTVTRGLPYIIGPDYQRLLRLNREYTHMQRWHGYASRRMIENQCEKLHRRVYHETCYYGELPPSYYAYNHPYM